MKSPGNPKFMPAARFKASPAVAAKAAELGTDFPGNPADRLIVATAILQSATLVTKDKRISKSSAVKTVW